LYAERFNVDQFPWRSRRSFANLLPSDLPEIQKMLSDAPTYFERLQQEFKEAFSVVLDWDQYLALGEQSEVIREINHLLTDEGCYQAFQKMVNETEEETSALWLANTERVLLDCYQGDGVELVVPAHQLGTLQMAVERTRKARRNIFGLLYWELFSKDKFLVTRALVGNGLQSNKKGFQALERKLDNRLNLEHNLSKLRTKPWLEVPETINKAEIAEWFLNIQRAIKAKLSFNQIRGIKNLVAVPNLSHTQFLQVTKRLLELVQPLPEKQAAWQNYLTAGQIGIATQSREVSNHLAKVLQRDFDALVEFDLLIGSLSSLEAAVINKLGHESNSWQFQVNEHLFLNSLSLAWIDHIEMKHPELRMVSSGKMELLEQELREQMHVKQSMARDIVMLRAREKVTEDLEFNRLNNRVTYRDLMHQVTKKRKVWPLRKVLTEFQEDVFRVLPCWLASPESVSAIFQMQEMFDLVVFDEASQCFAERGVPALYRARQAVVAGDSKQLRPGDFYLARWEDDTDAPDAEVESLLELSERYLPTVSLQGHYRSESVDLIGFSNEHFYNSKLKMIPHRKALNQREPALQFVKVEGIWDNGENAIEAQAVANYVLQYVGEHPNDSLGVITFNAPQQSLVLDFLEAAFRNKGTAIPESLFVKNIENVQGDERDVIIFSIGYAPDKKGRVNAQFGSLNVAGGENRLNVAVTRSRKKVVVVSSILPEQLGVSNTKNDGPKLLKRYLEYVLTGAHGSNQANQKREVQGFQLKNLIAKLGGQSNVQLLESIPAHDLTVVNGQVFSSALLLDDHPYFESPSLKYWHAQLPDLLESKGWPWARFFSRNSWANQERFEMEVEKWLLRE
ncbi:MAG: DEAD/DEAH box helicase, partial [Flammeovirgaceae bacterium]